MNDFSIIDLKDFNYKFDDLWLANMMLINECNREFYELQTA